jgi:poly(3-hydroxybutyrate) depolymerase
LLYDAYEMQRSLLAGASTLANMGAGWWQNPVNPFAYHHMSPVLASALDVFAHASAPRGKPEFGIDRVLVDGKTVPVAEEVVLRKPFGQLKRFRREGIEGGPKLLIVAPMSGHYATLLRGTVERMLPRHDVYITDWRDAKLVSLDEGRFDLDTYIDYLIEFLAHIGQDSPGGRAHMLAVCQPSVPCYAAACLMSEDRHPNRPATLTMMGGPIDTREAPTAVNTVATQRPHSWFQQNVIATVPFPIRARAGGLSGLPAAAGFMTMNLAIISPAIGRCSSISCRATARARSDQGLLRRVPVGLRHDGGILPPDDRCRVPAPPAAQGRDDATADAASILARSATLPSWRSRASATTSPASARPRRR